MVIDVVAVKKQSHLHNVVSLLINEVQRKQMIHLMIVTKARPVHNTVTTSAALGFSWWTNTTITIVFSVFFCSARFRKECFASSSSGKDFPGRNLLPRGAFIRKTVIHWIPTISPVIFQKPSTAPLAFVLTSVAHTHHQTTLHRSNLTHKRNHHEIVFPNDVPCLFGSQFISHHGASRWWMWRYAIVFFTVWNLKKSTGTVMDRMKRE